MPRRYSYISQPPMSWVHFYPFSPAGEHGGTLRLRTAQRACERLDDQQTFWFDHLSAQWRNDSARLSDVGAKQRPGLKRRVFPSTLYESGRLAVQAFRETDWTERVPANANVIFHTTYLAPLLADGTPSFRTATIDVYDLVWRAHAIDASLSRGPVRASRLIYSRAVKRREMRAIAHADAIAVAGYADWLHARKAGRPSSWCPTGMLGRPRPPHIPHDPPHVGFLGNFAHQPTIDSARHLLSCPAARLGEIKVILGGWESMRLAEEFSGQAQILGSVTTPDELWHQVDCAVIPVMTGAGMKCKIAEALLAGCPVITTRLGASGFSPTIHPMLHIVDRLSDITAALCLKASAAEVTQGALRDVTLEGASDLYARLLKVLVA